MRKAVLVFTIIAGLIALSQGMLALAQVGHSSPYSSRLWAGLLATACGPVGALAGWVGLRQPGLAALAIFVVAVAGSVSINLFYINTFYLLAAPLWLIASLVAVGVAFFRDASAAGRPDDGV